MKTRVLICGALTLASALTMIYVTVESRTSTVYDLAASLASETFGIALTVGIIDYLLERQRRHAAAKKIAWTVLCGVDQALWVWQGGRRPFEASELLGLIDMIDETDPRQDFTNNQLVRIGEEAQNNLKANEHVIGVNKDIKTGLERLTELLHIEDHKMTNNDVKNCISPSVTTLLAGLGQVAVATQSYRLRDVRDTRTDSQRRRYEMIA